MLGCNAGGGFSRRNGLAQGNAGVEGSEMDTAFPGGVHHKPCLVRPSASRHMQSALAGLE